MADEEMFPIDFLEDDDDPDAGIEEILGDARGGRVTIPWEMRDGEIVDLTPMQHRFCAEFLKDHNSRGAARRAGYKHYVGKNNNPFYKSVVQRVLRDELRYQYAAMRVNSSRLLAEMHTIAMATPNLLRTYAQMGIKVNLRDKVLAIETLMKHMNLFAEDNKKQLTISLPDMIKESFRLKTRPVPALPLALASEKGRSPAPAITVKDGDEIVAEVTHVKATLAASISDGGDDE